jgi:hypothetical protein
MLKEIITWRQSTCQQPLYSQWEVGVKGSLNPRPLPGSHGNSKVKPPKARIVLRWWHPNTWFSGAPTTMGHPIIIGVAGWTRYFQPTMWESRGLPLEVTDAGRLVHAGSRCSPLTGGSLLRGSLKSHDARFGITYIVSRSNHHNSCRWQHRSHHFSLLTLWSGCGMVLNFFYTK